MTLNKKWNYCILLLLLCIKTRAQDPIPAYKNSGIDIETRIKDLTSRLTLEEKISLLGFQSKAVSRLGIPAYNWWNEGVHGVARAGLATIFPQAIGMAATFNDSLERCIADIISTEARAKYNLASAADNSQQYMGLTFWSPNINIFRDPRWGRGQETYGEDPFLTASMGVAYVKGMQGNDPVYLKTAACAKHFAVHSGPEAIRHSFNAVVDEKDLRETYLYAFKKLVAADVESIMCAYNRLNDQPCCTNNKLLNDILKKEWKFKGHVVTDCWALEDIWSRHKVMNNSVEVAAAAVKAGVNLDCSNMLQDDLIKAVDLKLITNAEINNALAAVLRTQFKLGFFDEKNKIPFSRLGVDSIHTQHAIRLARIAAQQSMVLLKNNNNLLPLDKNKLHSIAVIGPNAGSIEPLLGNYHGISNNMVTFVEGITAAIGPAIPVQYDQGCDYTDTVHFGGIWIASGCDVTIAIIGLTPVIEGEEGDAFLATNGGDRKDLNIPAAHIRLLQQLKRNGKPIIAVITGGSALDIAAIKDYADAIIFAWYPGEQGGNALADILFGAVSPSGRLPVTFYKTLNDLPAYENYNLANRTYRYFKGEVQYPFGYGLSYTSFAYNWQQKPATVNSADDTLRFSVAISNIGNMDADEVAQVYIRYPEVERMPLKELKSFKRVNINKSGTSIVQFSIPVNEFQKWDLKENKWKLYKGEYHISVGGNSNDIQLDTKIKMNSKY